MKKGILTYKTHNLGDDIQTLATMQFFDYDYMVDRDEIGLEDKEMKIIGAGYWEGINFPPKNNIKMLPISIHIGNKDIQLDWFKENEPIGCRDLATKEFLESKGIKAYFSGCLTLTFPKYRGQRNNEVVLVGELPKLWYRQIKSDIIRKESQYIRDESLINNPEARLKEAQRLLDIYRKAKLVITSRLHTLLSCIAFGTPVIFHRIRKFDRFTGYDIPEYNYIDMNRDYVIPRPEKMIAKLKKQVKEFMCD